MKDLIAIGDVFKISSGGTPSRKKPEYYERGVIPWVKTGDLKGRYANHPKEYITQEALDNSSAKVFPENTVLLAMYGATIGACSILNFEAATNQACAALLPNDKCNPNYLYYFLKSNNNNIIRMGVGGAQPNISVGLIKKIKIPLPPLPIQQKIAAILDEADQLRQLNKQLIAKYDELTQSLFLDMFGDPVTNPMGWEKVELKSVISEGPSNGLYKPSSDYGSGSPIIRIDSFHNSLVNLEVLKRVRIKDSELERFEIKEGDFVINRVNSPSHLGKCGLVPPLNERVVYESNMMRIKFDGGLVHKYFMLFMLSTKYMKNQILNSSKDAVNQSSINQKDVNSFKSTIPPLDLQNQFAERVQAIEAQKAQAQQGLAKAEELFNSLLQRAFKGELVSPVIEKT